MKPWLCSLAILFAACVVESEPLPGVALYDDTVDETVTVDMLIDPEIVAEIEWLDPDDPTAAPADTCDVDPQGARAPQCGGHKEWAEWRCLCQVGGINCAWQQVRVGHQLWFCEGPPYIGPIEGRKTDCEISVRTACEGEDPLRLCSRGSCPPQPTTHCGPVVQQ